MLRPHRSHQPTTDFQVSMPLLLVSLLHLLKLNPCAQLEHHFFCEALLMPSQPYPQHFTSTYWSTQLRAHQGCGWVFSSISAVPRTQQQENLYVGPKDCTVPTLALSRLPEFVRHCVWHTDICQEGGMHASYPREWAYYWQGNILCLLAHTNENPLPIFCAKIVSCLSKSIPLSFLVSGSTKGLHFPSFPALRLAT